MHAAANLFLAQFIFGLYQLGNIAANGLNAHELPIILYNACPYQFFPKVNATAYDAQRKRSVGCLGVSPSTAARTRAWSSGWMYSRYWWCSLHLVQDC